MSCRLYLLTVNIFLAAEILVCKTAAVSIADRVNCSAGNVQPTTRVNTTERLQQLREHLVRLNLSAFIVLTQDAHNSEYTPDHDERRGFISGFGGSAGTAVVTLSSAALWTDGRYYLEAEHTLDCNWVLMKPHLPSTPNVSRWLNDDVTEPGATVGVDRTLISHSLFNSMKNDLLMLSRGLILTPVADNPVDRVWGQQQPPQPRNDVNALELKFSGVSWQEKIQNLTDEIIKSGASAFVVTALDETAWLFNLRGSDISYNPFFISYAIVERTAISLYILDKDRRLSTNPSDPETETSLRKHLGTGVTGSCEGKTGACVEVLEYNQIDVENHIRRVASNGTVWITHEANYAIVLATEGKYIMAKSPIALAKSQKNEVERAGMQRSYDRDSATLIRFLAFMENEIKSGKYWTEVSAAEELDCRRNKQQYSRGLSFPTISSYGSNGAIIHYRPSPDTDKQISTDSLYLLDSGGQYLDGTTDVTRTMHYGQPDAYQKECYTRVLMAAINLALLKWPTGLYGRQIDVIARAPLWELGLVYRHGTGHGIGSFLGVHEGPGRISVFTANTPSPSEEKLFPLQFYSDEPGYYEDGKFGIRLETIVMVNKFKPKYLTAGEQFLEFQPVTLVPFETNLIDVSLLNNKQIEWLNAYNSRTRQDISPLLHGDVLAIDWLNARTQRIQPFTLNLAPSPEDSSTRVLNMLLAGWTVFSFFKY